VSDAPVRIPEPVRPRVEEILRVTDAFCAGHLDQGYVELCRKLVAKLARRRPSPLARGDLRIWAGGVIYAVGAVNFLFDPSQRPHLTADQLSELTGIPKSTLANKARTIREALKIGPLDIEFCRREILEQHPMAWMISVNGFIVDARTMPPEVQAEARWKGLIPDLPAAHADSTGGLWWQGQEVRKTGQARNPRFSMP
jgi:hypothetical protein